MCFKACKSLSLHFVSSSQSYPVHVICVSKQRNHIYDIFEHCPVLNLLLILALQHLFFHLFWWLPNVCQHIHFQVTQTGKLRFLCLTPLPPHSCCFLPTQVSMSSSHSCIEVRSVIIPVKHTLRMFTVLPELHPWLHKLWRWDEHWGHV